MTIDRPSEDVEACGDVANETEELEFAQLSRHSHWSAVAASLRGRSHEDTGVACQDTAEYLVCPDTGALIAAVADGAGSAIHSEQGARAATEIFTADAQALLAGRNDLRYALSTAYKRSQQSVVDLAQRETAGDLSDYATTLLAVIWTKDELAAAQIGDGVVAVDGRIATEPGSGEYANQTTFVTTIDARPNESFTDEPVSQAAIMTDGLQNLALDYGGESLTTHAPFFDPLFEWLADQEDETRAQPQLSSFLSSNRVRERTHDDVTLLLATRQSNDE